MAKPAIKFNPPPPTTIEERVVAIETIIPSLATKSDLEGMENRLERRISGVERRISGLEVKVTGLEGKITGLEHKITGLEHKMNSMENKMDAKIMQATSTTNRWVLGVALVLVSMHLAQIGITFLMIRSLMGG